MIKEVYIHLILNTKRIFLITLMLLLSSDTILLTHQKLLWFIPLLSLLVLLGFYFTQNLFRSKTVGLNWLILSMGVSLAVLIFSGLFLDVTLPLIGINRPLEPVPVVAFLNLIIILLNIFNRRLYKSYNVFTLRVLKPSTLDVIFISINLLLLLVVIFGVNLLNNTGKNALLIFMLTAYVFLPILIVYFRKRITVWTYIITILLLSLALLFISTLKGSYLMGSDILGEFHVFNNVFQNGIWKYSNPLSEYNACLSITILPQMLHVISGTTPLFIFKVITQIIFSLTPVIVFLIARSYLSKTYAFMCCIAFMGFNNYLANMPNHIRQEMGLLFFSLCVYVLLSQVFSLKQKRIFLIIFGLTMIVSHYSTAYIAIIFFFGFILSYWLIEKLKKYDIFTKNIANGDNYKITITLASLFLIFATFWYSQIVPLTGGPLGYVKSVLKQVTSQGYQNEFADQTSIGSQFNIFNNTTISQTELYTNYIEHIHSNTNGVENVLLGTPTTKPKIKPLFLDKTINFLVEIIIKIYKLLIFVGIIIMIFAYKRRPKNYTRALECTIMSSIIVIGLSFILPSFTVSYSQERMFQQLLVILSIPIILCLMSLKFKNSNKIIISAIFLSIYMLISTGIVGQITGGLPVPTQLNNYGVNYGQYYVHKSEVLSSEWLDKYRNKDYNIYSDAYGANRLLFSSTDISTVSTLIPSQFNKPYYVYYDYANYQYNETYTTYKNGLLVLSSPTLYLSQNSNLTYSNGQSAVYEY